MWPYVFASKPGIAAAFAQVEAEDVTAEAREIAALRRTVTLTNAGVWGLAGVLILSLATLAAQGRKVART